MPPPDAPSERLRAILDEYISVRRLADGRWIGLLQLMFHYTIHVGISETGYEDRWCISSLELARDSFDRWDGTGEPAWWHKHPATGRYRDLATGRSWHSSEITPEGIELSGWPHNFELSAAAAPLP